MSDLTLEQITTTLSDKLHDKKPFGHSVKFVLSDLGTVVLDGTGDSYIVSNEDSEADVTLTLTSDTLHKMQQGEMTGMDAFFQGLLSIEGDQSVALQLGEILRL